MKPLRMLALALVSTHLLAAPEPADGPRAVPGAAGAIYVDDGGSGGLPVVFLHSFGGDSTHWASHLDHLRHHRRALAIDLRGHGKSARPTDMDYSMKAFVRDLETVVKDVKLERFVLVGHSLGAAVANAYAAKHPSQVAGVVLVGAPGKVPPTEAKQVVAALEKNYAPTMKQYMDRLLAGAQPHVKTELLAQMASMAPADSVAIIRSMFAEDPQAAFERYKGPRLLIDAVRPGADTGLHVANPSAKRVTFEGTSHWPHLDEQKRFTMELEAFLARLR